MPEWAMVQPSPIFICFPGYIYSFRKQLHRSFHVSEGLAKFICLRFFLAKRFNLAKVHAKSRQKRGDEVNELNEY
jgi:hypothetical protein